MKEKIYKLLTTFVVIMGLLTIYSLIKNAQLYQTLSLIGTTLLFGFLVYKFRFELKNVNMEEY